MVGEVISMRILHLVWLLLSVVATSVSAQTLQPCGTEGGVVLVASKPTLYISFEEVSESSIPVTRLASDGKTSEKPPTEQTKTRSNGGKVIWLRLHNNTRWAISVPTESLYIGPAVAPIWLCNGRSALAVRDSMKINVQFEMELLTTRDSLSEKNMRGLPSLNRSDVFSASWLPAGGSLLFSVPGEYLMGNSSAIYVPFNYEWEYGDRTFTINEPQHRIYFRPSDLPKEMQSRIR